MNPWSPRPKGRPLSIFREYGNVFIAVFLVACASVTLLVVMQGATVSTLRVSFLDIGQGDSILIQTPSGHDVLIDGGPNDAVLARLDEHMNYFDRNLDMIVSTHDDADHSTGLIPVLAKYDVKHVVRSPVYSDTELAHVFASSSVLEGATMHIGTRGDVIDFGDGAVVYVLYPGGNVSPKTDTNDASVSIVLTYGEHSFLLTGDLPSAYESRLVGDRLPKHVTVFKAGHHGSKTSSGETLLSYIKPEYAVISAGKDNRYGHPNAETLERLNAYAKETLSTIDRGTITFESDGKTLTVKTEK